MASGDALPLRRSAAVLALWLLLLLVASFFAPSAFANPMAIRAFILEFGSLAPLVFVLVQATQVVVAPIPGQVLGFVAGYLFGAATGTALSLIGATIGTYVAVRLARRYGRPAVERVVPTSTLAGFDDAVARRGLLALFIVFLIPGLPDDAICFVAGLSRLDVRWVLAVSLVGRLPGYAVVSLAGARVAGGHPGDAVVLLGVLAVVSVLVYLRRDVVGRWLARPADSGR